MAARAERPRGDPDARPAAAVAKAVVTDQGVYLVADGLPVNDRANTVYVLWAANAQGRAPAVATFDVRGGAPVQLDRRQAAVQRSRDQAAGGLLRARPQGARAADGRGAAAVPPSAAA